MGVRLAHRSVQAFTAHAVILRSKADADDGQTGPSLFTWMACLRQGIAQFPYIFEAHA
jgi:hypothetical protein